MPGGFPRSNRVTVKLRRANNGTVPLRQALSATLLAPLLLALPGCAGGGRAPNVIVFGSYFPAWIVCGLVGVVCAFGFRAAMTRAGIDEAIPARLLVYISVALICALTIWLFMFGRGA